MVDLNPVAKKGKIDSTAASRVKKGAAISFDRELAEVELLGNAFTAFNDAAESLTEYYGHLEKRVGGLNRELADKSVALEESLKEVSTMERYQANILRSLPSAVIVMDVEGKVITFNRRAEEITGLLRGEADGKRIEDVFGEGDFPYVHALPSFDDEISYTNMKGDRLTLKVSTSPLVDDDGRRDGTVLILHDITRERLLEEKLERGKRLAAMGEMAAKLAHEIRNPLGGIELFASNLKKNLAENTRERNMAENICGGVSSLNYLVTNILQFAKMEKPVATEVFVSDSIDNALMMASHLIERCGIEVVRSYQHRHEAFMGDREMVKQAILNIILNAVQAMEDEGGTLQISSHRDAKGMVNMIFDDEGRGIPEKELERVFDPFYSTKERGTGLGLAIVHNIVDASNGRIDIESIEGKGTSVTLSFPCKMV